MADIHPAVSQNLHSLGFGVRSHPPPSLNFGFGMTNPHFTPSTLASLTPARSNKRRLESENSDDGMDTRSPTPEVGRRLPVKRLRGSLSSISESDGHAGRTIKTSTPQMESDGDGIDMGFMLALLPPQTLVPLISSLLKENPALKSSILSLMPRPSLESALHAISQSTSKLKSALPYSSSCFSHTDPNPRVGVFGTSMEPNPSSMRESYIQSRISSHLNEFTTNILSVLPFFSLLPSSIPSRGASQGAKAHPSETFAYLAAVTRELLGLPPICQTALRATLIPRLLTEWKAWLSRVDDHVNNQAGMFGLATLKSWESELDEFANFPNIATLGLGELLQIRDSWIAGLGFLVGRSQCHNRMDDEL